MRSVKKILVLLAAIYIALLGGLFGLMHSPAAFGQVMARLPRVAFMVIPFRQLWSVARAGRLKAGDEAPEFKLTTLDRKSEVRLSSFRGQRPVVLIFGSYT